MDDTEIEGMKEELRALRFVVAYLIAALNSSTFDARNFTDILLKAEDLQPDERRRECLHEVREEIERYVRRLPPAS